MKRLFVGLTLLLMAFFSSLDHLDALHRFLARIGVQPWMTELLLALLVVAAFAWGSQLHRRLLFPRRGLRLLLAGIVVYVLGAVVATGALVGAAGWIPLELDSSLSGVARIAAMLSPLPLWIAGEVLLAVGAFRALTNLVPPEEFAADF